VVPFQHSLSPGVITFANVGMKSPLAESNLVEL
jgi:hypothetical protein